jgi:Uma2 family endonuclease
MRNELFTQGSTIGLDLLDRPEGQEDRQYDLDRGALTEADTPDAQHLAQVECIRQQLAAFCLAHPGQIHDIGVGADCKLLLPDRETVRHPDLAIYQTPAPKGPNPWHRWVPEIVIEVVSASSRQRDYDEKPREYLHCGVREYWIVDAERCEMLVLGRWRRQIIQPPEAYCTPLLGGFIFACQPVFMAARAAER